jgi:hypothetical protein
MFRHKVIRKRGESVGAAHAIAADMGLRKKNVA